MWYVVFGVVCLVCSGFVFLFCESKLLNVEQAAQIFMPEPEALPAFKCKQLYITLYISETDAQI